jgi:hypothetical protein
MNRRGFIGGLLAMPLVVRASSIMPVRSPRLVTLLELYGRWPSVDFVEAVRATNEILEDALFYGGGALCIEPGCVFRMPMAHWRQLNNGALVVK